MAESDEEGSEDEEEGAPVGRGRLKQAAWNFRLVGREVTDENRDKPVTTAQHILGLAKLPQVRQPVALELFVLLVFASDSWH